MVRRSTGFNVIEMLVIVAIVLAMAGVVIPVVSMRKLDHQWQRIDDDLAAITEGLREYVLETRTFPTGHSGATSYHFLHTAGALPKNNVFDSGPAASLSKFLQAPDMATETWKGPYLGADVGSDPWGNAYVVNVNGFFNSSERVYAICAGPNGRIDTSPSATVPGGDDVLSLVK